MPLYYRVSEHRVVPLVLTVVPTFDVGVNLVLKEFQTTLGQVLVLDAICVNRLAVSVGVSRPSR